MRCVNLQGTTVLFLVTKRLDSIHVEDKIE